MPDVDNIREIKKHKYASKRVVVDCLKEALKEANDFKYDAISIVLSSNKGTYADWQIAKGGSITSLIGGLERAKKRIMEAWDTL